MRSINIPFQGFYDSIHSMHLEDTYNRYFEDDSGEEIEGLDVPCHDWNAKLLTEYAKLYVTSFTAEIGLEFTFEELTSPREYNFGTDRIFCKISEDSIIRMLKDTDQETLERVIKDRFTSYDGFVSFYSNELADWPNRVIDWDANQLDTLLAAYIEVNHDFEEIYSMDNASSNGHIDSIVFDELPQSTIDLINSIDRG